mmetsp:Transcript_10783/g.35415  ORF Transcript_10783/g.35415 Transcript_10783/m.35415 type:complete len:276 (-) Transcript_10783:835-1662(-)
MTLAGTSALRTFSIGISKSIVSTARKMRRRCACFASRSSTLPWIARHSCVVLLVLPTLMLLRRCAQTSSARCSGLGSASPASPSNFCSSISSPRTSVMSATPMWMTTSVGRENSRISLRESPIISRRLSMRALSALRCLYLLSAMCHLRVLKTLTVDSATARSIAACSSLAPSRSMFSRMSICNAFGMSRRSSIFSVILSGRSHFATTFGSELTSELRISATMPRADPECWISMRLWPTVSGGAACSSRISASMPSHVSLHSSRMAFTSSCGALE